MHATFVPDMRIVSINFIVLIIMLGRLQVQLFAAGPRSLAGAGRALDGKRKTKQLPCLENPLLESHLTLNPIN